MTLYSSHGRIGTFTKSLNSSKTMYSKFSLPSSIVEGDKFDVPITLINNREVPIQVNLEVTKIQQKEKENLGKISETFDTVTIGPKSQEILKYKMVSGIDEYEQKQKIVAIMHCAETKKMLDVMERETQVISRGLLDFQTCAGMIGHGGQTVTQLSKKFTFSKDIVCSVPTFNITLFTSMVDSLLEAVKSLIHTPCGCFEQTSATTYPMVMALQLLQQLIQQF